MNGPNQLLVVGTGRCGSTLLSGMLRAHPEVLSVSELFAFVTDLGNVIPRAFPRLPIDGEAFWRILATPYPRQNLLLRHGLRMDEVIYPFGQGRFRGGELPAIQMATLPHLSDDPDALFDALASAMRSRPTAPIGAHFQALFAWLAEHAPRRRPARAWAERSGGSLRIVGRLLEVFPDARVLHIVRDGRDTAISMSRHIGFRMALVGFQLLEFLGLDPFEDEDRSEVDDLPDELVRLLPENFDAEGFWGYDIAPSLCGHYWSGEIKRGLEVLDGLPAGRVATIRYESILEDPRAAVERLGELLAPAEADPEWALRAAAMVGRGRSSWRALPAADRRELEDACAPGFAALAARGITWSDAPA